MYMVMKEKLITVNLKLCSPTTSAVRKYLSEFLSILELLKFQD